MKPKTDPKTMTTQAYLASAEVTAACKTIDALRMAAMYEGEPGKPDESTMCMADTLAAWVKDHKPIGQKN